MALFTSGTPNRSGVFARERIPPAIIRPGLPQTAAMVATLPWGPGAVGAGVLYTPNNVADFLKTFAPAGVSRASSGVLAALSFPWPILKVVRVIGTGAAAAQAQIQKAGPLNLCKVNAKYLGATGNSFTATVSAATDGDANHFDLTVSISGTNGTTTETYRNLNLSGVGADVLPSAGNSRADLDLNNSTLVGSVTKDASGLPLVQAYTFTGGLDGAIAAAQYTGTAGTGDAGIAVLESDRTIRHIFTDDCGNALRATVNAALKVQADTILDRVAYLSGNSGQSASAAQTDAANYLSANTLYADCWFNVYNDQRVLTLIPSHIAAAAMAANLSPSTSIMWRDPVARRIMTSIVSLEANRDGNAAGANTAAGISTLIPFPGGGFCFEVGKVTINKTTPSKGNLTRTLMGIYIAASVVDSLQSNVGAPNVKLNQQDIVTAIDNFLTGLKQEQFNDPNNKPFILDYNIEDIGSSNTQTDLDSGNFTVAANVKTAAAMERIFFDINYGETVQIIPH